MNQLSNECTINPFTHSFMRMFVNKDGSALNPGPTLDDLVQGVWNMGHGNMSSQGILALIAKLSKVGVVEKRVPQVCPAC